MKHFESIVENKENLESLLSNISNSDEKKKITILVNYYREHKEELRKEMVRILRLYSIVYIGYSDWK